MSAAVSTPTVPTGDALASTGGGSPSAPVLRPLTPAERRLLTAARLRALQDCPYFAHALFNVVPVAADGLETFAVDASWRLYLDTQVLAEWGPQQAAGVLNHEVSHLLREHAPRGEALGPQRNHLAWNYATDAAINDDLLAAGVVLPEGVVTPESFGLPAQGIEESYYAALLDRVEDQQDEGVGCGSGAGDRPAAWELPTSEGLGGDGTGEGAGAGEPSQQAPAVSEARAKIIRRSVAQAVTEHAQQHGGSGRGTVPAGLRRWAESTLAGPVVDWRRAFAATVRRAINYRAGQHTPTYTRLPRHRLPGIVTPGSRRPQVTVAVVVDTSGSVGAAQLRAALAEVRGVVKAAGVPDRGLAVLACDADVTATTRVHRVSSIGADLDLSGGGGTDMRVGIAAAEQMRPRPDAVVVLTDGYTPWPQVPTRARLIVGVLAEPGAAPSASITVPPWAHRVDIPVA
jgi:predicted metal-dependent peptidase